jgi:hypothetical protein
VSNKPVLSLAGGGCAELVTLLLTGDWLVLGAEMGSVVLAEESDKPVLSCAGGGCAELVTLLLAAVVVMLAAVVMLLGAGVAEEAELKKWREPSRYSAVLRIWRRPAGLTQGSPIS